MQKDNLVMMLRDNASNVKKACDDLGIKSFGCIGHTLHLIVGPLFIQKNSSTNEDEDLLDDTVDYDDEELADVLSNFTDERYKENVKKLNKVVTDFRNIAKYIRKSTIATEKVGNIEKTNGNKSSVSLDLDVRTRWNSTLHMLQKLVRMKTSLCIFMHYLKSPEGKHEFNYKKLPTMLEEDWALIEGTCIVLGIFAKATEALSAEKYPTFVYSMPILRKKKMHLSKDDMLSKNRLEKDVKEFYTAYGTETFLPSILTTLETIRMGLLQEFKMRFSGMTVDIMWTTLLDPRCRSRLSSIEKKEAKLLLIEEVKKTFNNQENTQSPAYITNDRENIHDFDIFDSPVKDRVTEESSQDDIEQYRLLVQSSANREVDNYLDPTIVVSP
jgi:hypothetical protein